MKVVETTKDEQTKVVGMRILASLKQEHLICLPSGESMKDIYAYVVNAYQKQPFEIQATVVGLDEWVGMDVHDIGGCQHEMYERLFQYLPLGDKLMQFDAKNNNLDEECKKMDTFIANRDFDLIVLGIGMNGHLGLNEPGVNFQLKSHVSTLDDTTQKVAQKYFETPVKLTGGITLGCYYFQHAKELLLVANGKRKQKIVNQIINSEITNQIPATIAKANSNATLFTESFVKII